MQEITMKIVPIRIANCRRALADGWQMANATRGISIGYSLVFVLGGLAIIGSLLAQGLTPFIIPAAGAFMLIGPVILAGFFGVATAKERGEVVGFGSIVAGFSGAHRALWALSLVCGLLFMIFVTDAAILYAYMLGQAPVWLTELIPVADGVIKFFKWAAVSGFVVALLLYCISAFSVPLLCDARANLVQAIVISVRIVFGSFPVTMAWAGILAILIIGSIVLLPLLPLALPWLAYSSRSLYRQAIPMV